MSNEQRPVKLTASQRLDNLEQALMSLYQTADNMARDLLMVKEAIKLLGNKLDAVVKAANGNEGINDEVIAKLMVQNNVDELKNRVENMKTQGFLAAEETVTDNSFVVGREVDENGAVVNPRLQFTMTALPKETSEKIKGSKAGDIITLQEGKLKLEVLETYAIQVPQQQAPAEAQA